MCYAIPGQVVRFEGSIAHIEYFGEERKAHNEIDELQVGDYVYAQGGFVIERLKEEAALEILAVWKETFFELQEVDLRLSRIDLEEQGLSPEIGRILDRALEGRPLKEEQLLALLELEDEGSIDLLCKTANFLRQKHLKNSCCVHGILEISNHCTQGCAYCGISTCNDSISRYRMSREEIVEAAVEAVERYGFKSLVLQSGEDPGYTVEELCAIVRAIKERTPALIFISFGEVGLEGLEKLYEAGARGILMRFETSNRELYEQLHPGMDFDSRIAHLRRADELGYLILTGGLVGLPGQTKQDLLNDLFLARELNAEMYSFGPMLPHPETPLADAKPATPSEVMKVLAAARLMAPEEAKILITTALETLDPASRREGLMAGGNSVMLNVTPIRYRRQYVIYENRRYQDDEIQTQIDETIGLLSSLGRAPTDLSVRT